MWLPTSYVLDYIQRRRVFQGGCVAEFFAEICGAYNAAHHFCVSRFWYVADENDFTRRERFAEVARNILFQFSGERRIAIFIFYQNPKTNQSFACDGIRDANPGGFAHLRMRDEDRFENFWRHESILSRTNARFLRLF